MKEKLWPYWFELKRAINKTVNKGTQRKYLKKKKKKDCKVKVDIFYLDVYFL